MADCEICGNKATTKANVDGIVLDVCPNCVSLGEPVSLSIKKPKKRLNEPEELFLSIRVDFSKVIKESREKMNLKIEELASKIKEKESVMSRVESGKLKPTIKLARKLERFFDINLIEEE